MMAYIAEMWALALEGEKQGVLFFVVIYVLIVCLYSLVRQLLIRRWPLAKGKLLSATVEKWGVEDIIPAEQDYKAAALYEYEVAGRRYRGRRVSPWVIVASYNARMLLEKQLSGVRIHPDGSVDVLYKPGKPHKSYLVKPGLFGMALTFGIAVIPLILYLRAYA
ncbi:DUF3592 domain-containing protein [Granulosicoccaceae sp. 1_MG-2023]|nr:DUF3592 domain-containing protein [Granulosicoccaceae sp. 1_MG-2023]